MNDAILIAVIVGVVPMASAISLSYLNNRFSRQRQEADWERQDEVAARATAAVAEVAEKLSQVDAQAKATHVFLNADKTAERRRTLVLTETLLISLKDTAALNRTAGRRGSKAATGQIKALEAEIDALKKEITTRDEQTHVADVEIAKASSSG